MADGLPAYAPELNATESAWAHLTTGLGNRLFHGLEDPKTTITRRLRDIQQRPDLITGFLHHTGLPLEPT
ncbi:hypothetical protein [Actinocorallia libanotica]|uniref:DDE superfamily endonuclease n=1 Tax=Actinocorallia libanotica TaxID=46162 RepID=A0ABP4CDT8_9ACTN